MDPVNRWLSRKFLAPLVLAVLAWVNGALGLGIPDHLVQWIAGAVVAFIVGESAVDVARQLKAGKL